MSCFKIRNKSTGLFYNHSSRLWTKTGKVITTRSQLTYRYNRLSQSIKMYNINAEDLEIVEYELTESNLIPFKDY